MKNSNTKLQIFHNLDQILEMCPQYSTSQHLIHMLRSKGNSPDPYYWSEEFLLKRLEDYYDELVADLVFDAQNKEDVE